MVFILPKNSRRRRKISDMTYASHATASHFINGQYDDAISSADALEYFGVLAASLTDQHIPLGEDCFCSVRYRAFQFRQRKGDAMPRGGLPLT